MGLKIALGAGAIVIVGAALFWRGADEPSPGSGVDTSVQRTANDFGGDAPDTAREMAPGIGNSKIKAWSGIPATPARQLGRPAGRPAPQMVGGADRARRQAEADENDDGMDGGDSFIADPLDSDLDDIPTLRRIAVEDPDPDRRLDAVTLLGVSEDQTAVPALAEALHDDNEEVRVEAVLSLAEFPGDAAVEALEVALRDKSAEVRYEALDVLSELGGERARRAIQGTLDDPDEEVRDLAEMLIEELEDIDPEDLAEMDDEEDEY
jgi:hypothetical protein